MNTAHSTLDAVFRPRSIAVIGATNRPGTIGRELLANLLRSEFTGAIFPVNPHQPVVLCMKSYASVLDIADEVDLAIVLVAKEHVLNVVDECGRKGVKGLVIITAGFKEVGAAGAAREQAVGEVLNRYGIRAIGPNCMGIVNTDPRTSVNATFSRAKPPAGNVAFMTQSGALGEAIISHAHKVGIGFSMFASMGNTLDISANDLLAYWAEDAHTEVVLLYLESFGDPKHFTRIAREVSRRKPMVAVKAGRTDAGARAAFSHTGALAGLDAGADALFEQCGVLRVASVEELFDVALALSRQPLPAGNRVAVITNAGGPGIMATDACANLGLDVPELSEATRRKLATRLREEASTRNPVDVIASGGPDDYAIAIEACGDDPGIDALLVVFIPPIMVNAPEIARAIVRAKRELEARGITKPMVSCLLNEGSAIEAARTTLAEARIPTYLFPESAARALSALAWRAAWLSRPESEVPTFAVDRATARQIVDDAFDSNVSALGSAECAALLTAYGVPVARGQVTRTAKDALAAAHAIGYPVVLKLEAAGLVHKTDIGGVVTDVRNDTELSDHFHRLRMTAAEAGFQEASVLVQPMIKGGREIILGMTRDPKFGPLLMFGLGGVDVEVLHDVAFRIHPLTRLDASEMVRAIRARRLLEGFRGEPAADIGLLEDALLRLSQLVSECPEIEQIEINPFLVSAPGRRSAAVDVRVKLANH